MPAGLGSQTRGRNRSETGQKRVRHGPETCQKWVRNGSELGQKRVRTGATSFFRFSAFSFRPSAFGFRWLSPFGVRLLVFCFQCSGVGSVVTLLLCTKRDTHTQSHTGFFWKHRFLESVITQYMFDYKGYTLPMLQASMANFQHHICTGCLTGQNGSETGRKWVRNGSEMG